LTCYSILDFHYELKITASEDIPNFWAGSNFWTKPSPQKQSTVPPIVRGVGQLSTGWNGQSSWMNKVKSLNSQACPGTVVILVVQVLCLCLYPPAKKNRFLDARIE
jgi:hypothetical protein